MPQRRAAISVPSHIVEGCARDSQLCMNNEVGSMMRDCEELIRMLTAIVKTAQKNSSKN